MATKRTRTKNVSSGVKKNRSGKQLGRRSPAIDNHQHRSYLKTQDEYRFPTHEAGDVYASLNRVKQHRGPIRNSLRTIGWPLMEQAVLHSKSSSNACYNLLLAASLKVKRVKRHPGWILQRTYNLKTSPIVIV